MLRHAHLAFWLTLTVGPNCACSRDGTAPIEPAAVAELQDKSGNTVGSATFTVVPGGVRIDLQAFGLAPGAHGVHIHAVGACDGTAAAPFSSAGGHFNPTSRQHGRLNPAGWHGGDLPNLVVSASGQGSSTVVAEHLTIDGGAGALFDADGSAIVIHANEDDQQTDTGPLGPGNSGARIACGLITRA